MIQNLSEEILLKACVLSSIKYTYAKIKIYQTHSQFSIVIGISNTFVRLLM